MNIGICDDYEKDRELLTHYVAQYIAALQLDYTLSTFESGEDFLESVPTQKYDIVFLDIYMKGKTGVDTARILRETDRSCLIIFTTTSLDHALDGFEVGAVHYLVKPLKYKDVEIALDRCKQLFAAAEKYIDVKTGHMYTRVLIKEIIFAEVYSNTVLIHTNSEEVKAYISLDELAKLLPTDIFLRCHRSYIVNMGCIASQDGSDFILKSGTKIPIPRKELQQMRKRYTDYLFNCIRRRNDAF
ncbi:MAG: LytTR family DNA-binding domain-containing protein [Lachnospiraceae bacterium]|nr:LytTR family DNA-binding domain-containing protein [Lachnospiraceae bacterium]